MNTTIHKKKAPIIFIWVGSPIPSWSVSSINFASEKNPDRKVLLLIDESSFNIYSNLNIKFEVETLTSNILKRSEFKGEINYQDRFWINTARRLLILYWYSSINNLDSFFHAEIDNIIFNLNKLDYTLDSYSNGLFAPRDSTSRVIASLIYCNRKESLNEVFKYFLAPYSAKTEMEALGFYAKNNKNFISLPTESYPESSKSWKIIDWNLSKGVFDAAAIGQYILGVDTIHFPYGPLYNKFRNENCLIDLDKLTFSVDKSQLYITYKNERTKHKLYNIHVHSKQISLAIKMLNNNTSIIERLNTNKKSLIANRHRIFTGKLYLAAHRIKKLFRSIKS